MGRTSELPEDSHEFALFAAAVAGDRITIQSLLQQGVSLDVTDAIGSSLLHSCAQQGHLECLRFLLDRGMNVNSRNIDGLSPLHVASTDCISLLLSRGADIEATCKDGLTPLIWCACTGKAASLRVLLDSGADVNAKDKSGFTSWLWAAFNGFVDCLHVLKACKPNLLAKTNEGKGALELAGIALSEAVAAGHEDLIPDMKESVHYVQSVLEREHIQEECSLVESTKRKLAECEQGMTVLLQQIRELESIGNYPEASVLHDKFESLSSQAKALERSLVKAQKRYNHDLWAYEFKELIENFNHLWDKYLQEYDMAAESYLQNLLESTIINVPIEKVQTPFSPSKSLAYGRAKELTLARLKRYEEAAALKKSLDEKEQRERARKEEKNRKNLEDHVAMLTSVEELKLSGVKSRIKTRRKEHRRQRDLDLERLMRLREGRDSIPVLERREFSDAKPLHLQTPWDSDLRRPCIVQPARTKIDLSIFEKTERNTFESFLSKKV